MKGDAIVESERPRIGMLGIMQELYDEMIPRITEHQAEFSRALCEQLSPVADVIFTRPARNRDDIEEIVRDLNTKDLDGIMIVMLTYGPAMRTLRALQQNPLPLLLANIQPEPVVTAQWTMDDLTYNQGIHGAQDQSNAMLRAGLPYSVITEAWRSPEFMAAFESWARAAQTVTKLKHTKIALFGYPMNGMEDVLYDAAALLRKIGPTIINENLGDVFGHMQLVEPAAVEVMRSQHAVQFEMDPNLKPENHEYAIRFELALREIIAEGNWRIARSDRPIRLVDRPLGIGGLDNPPTTVFSAEPGTATTATLIALEGEHYRLAVARGEILDTPELPLVQMPYFHFRPDSGMRHYLTAWLRNGGTHHFCLNLGDHVERWRILAELLDIEFVQI